MDWNKPNSFPNLNAKGTDSQGGIIAALIAAIVVAIVEFFAWIWERLGHKRDNKAHQERIAKLREAIRQLEAKIRYFETRGSQYEGETAKLKKELAALKQELDELLKDPKS